MTPITLTRFEKSNRTYTTIDSFKACLCSEIDNCASIQGHMKGLIRQLYKHHDEPIGWSFAEWRRGTNHKANLIGSNAIVLEYALRRDDSEIVNRLHDNAERLGWTHFLIDTETKRGNTISLVFPLTSLINEAQYVRLASILAEEMDEYGMEEFSIAATHIIHVHRITTPVVYQGTPLDPIQEIKRTAKMYQRLNARKFEGTRPAGQAVSEAGSSAQPIEDGLFCWYETPQEVVRREALETMVRYGLSPE